MHKIGLRILSNVGNSYLKNPMCTTMDLLIWKSNQISVLKNNFKDYSNKEHIVIVLKQALKPTA